ncbi:MAG: hypothetical protein DME90_00255 [Verrucomicrobia bacterium]|nr:MAG: hypothetical protein DME90_00255 [Verrucomicrobiota bacterium]
MALIRCYECGKEISSLATACPSCGAPTRSNIVPPSLPTRARPVSRAKQFFLGTLAVLTGLLFVFLIRGLTHQPNTPSAAASPTPATTEPATRGSPPIEMALERSGTPIAAQTPTAESATTSSPTVEAAAASSPSPAEAETPNTSDAFVATATSPGATYQVIGIPQDDYLNVREGAGSDYEVITRLEPGTGGILLGTKRVTNGATTWQEITVHGETGWVNAAYIALETQVPTSPTESSTAP